MSMADYLRQQAEEARLRIARSREAVMETARARVSRAGLVDEVVTAVLNHALQRARQGHERVSGCVAPMSRRMIELSETERVALQQLVREALMDHGLEVKCTDSCRGIEFTVVWGR